MTFKQLAGQLPRTGGTIDVGANVNKNTPGPGFGGHIVDVEVDQDTGKVTVLRYTAVQDVGTAIHPSYVEGQIQGGVAQGIGMALTEEYYYDEDGRMHELQLPRLPHAHRARPADDRDGPGRGAEPRPPLRRPRRRRSAIVPPLAAAQGAIAEATGVRFNTLPITSKVILEELIKDE